MNVRHGNVSLQLHALREPVDGDDPARIPPLLLLHALAGSSGDWSSAVQAWPAAVYALDFSGHGESQWLPGGGYTPERLAADADCALAGLGCEVRVAGTGLGAYAALLLSGARPEQVTGSLLLPGRGLAGGGPLPCFEDAGARRDPLLCRAEPAQAGPTDPLAFSCECDVRPIDYAEEFARRARRLLVARPAPESGSVPWLEKAAGFALEVEADLPAALKALASDGR